MVPSPFCWKVQAAEKSGPLVRGCLVAFLIGSCSAPLAVSADSNMQESVISASRRFVVIGTEREVCAAWTTRMESIDTRLARLIGKAPPVGRLEPVRIKLQSNPDSTSPPVFHAQSLEESRLNQTLYVNLAKYTPIEVYEGLSRLLCNRFVYKRLGTNMPLEDMPRLPDWFSTGIALHIDQRESDKWIGMAHDMWEKGDLPSIEEILANDTFPARIPPRQEALSYSMVRWLISESAFKRTFRRLLETTTAGSQFDSEGLVSVLENVGNREELEQEWQLSVAKSARMERLLILPDSVETMHRINTIMDKIPAQYSMFAGERISIATLPEYRDAGWMLDLCNRMLASLQDLGITADPELQKLITVYARIFEDMLKPQSGSLVEFYSDSVSTKSLLERIMHAEALRERIASHLEECEAYLDRVEKNVYNMDTDWEDKAGEEEIEYIENIDRQFMRGTAE